MLAAFLILIQNVSMSEFCFYTKIYHVKMVNQQIKCVSFEIVILNDDENLPN